MGKGIFVSWWRFKGELLVSPPTHSGIALYFFEIGGVHNAKEVRR